MKNRIVLICTIVSILCSATSCREGDRENMPSNSIATVENMSINNNEIEEASTNYSIVDLRYVFNNNNYHRLTLQDIDLVFPIEYLRWNDGCYLVYPVKEGGKFCVFFDTLLIGQTTTRLVYSDSMYIHNLPKEKDFDMLQKGDLYQRVQEIAPCTILISVLSSGPLSYSLLSDGSVMRCSYTAVKGNMILDEWGVVSEDDIQYPFKTIFPYDRAE